MVEGARLESVYTSKAYRGFESHLLRQNFNPFKGLKFILGAKPTSVPIFGLASGEGQRSATGFQFSLGSALIVATLMGVDVGA